MLRYRGRLNLLIAVGLACASTGCVERRYTIRTDPPGAQAFVNGEQIGTTPVSRSFTFYGDRTVRLVKEGYETQDVVAKFEAPWYDNLLTEFFTENLNPYTFRDEVEFNYKLQPATPDDPNNVLNRAEATRAEGQAPALKRRGGILGFFGG
ncbi:PEGA domain-containing protein [Tundrisphaera lichenicola]|uniref:PEGA domain-containing protein n=1 Tax=Tundrisphaera lichenicola TaxID=2029860 RepID=UPI003EBA6275